VSSHCTILYNIILLLVLILSVTLSTTKTKIVWWISTEYRRYDIAEYIVWSISSTSCYNTLERYWTYINGVYTNEYYAYTTKTCSSVTWSSTNTMYFKTTRSYTATSSLYTIESTLTIYTYYNHYFETYLKTDFVTIIDTDILISFSTVILYSTITRLLAPSPSILQKNKCTCALQLCNKIDLVLLTINNIV
jgi:hypothetical protein